MDENVEYEEREDEFDIVSLSIHYYYCFSHLDLPDLVLIFPKEDEQVLLQRKMKAEEEDVDIDTVVSHTASASGRKSGGGTHSGNMGGAATPVGSSGNAHGGDIGAMGEASMGDAGAIDIDVIWAEESPDDDLPSGWKMRVVMDNEAADYY